MIDSLEKNYKVKIKPILEGYKDLYSVKDIAELAGTTPYVVRSILLHLQLKRPKSKRITCYEELQAMLEDESIDEFTTELEDENLELHRKLRVQERALNRARFELNRYRKENRDLHKVEAVEDRCLDVFEDYLKLAKPMKPKRNIVVAPRKELPQFGVIAMLSDVHLGEKNGKDVPQNPVDYDVLLSRLDYYLDRVLQSPYQSKEIIVAQLGDMIKGIIHGGIFTSEGSFIESLNKAVDFSVYAYSTLASVYEKVHVYSVTGNHDRISENPKTVDKALDYTRLIDSMVARQLKALGYKNIEIYVTDIPYHLVEVNGAEIIMFHGDTVRSYSPSSDTQRAKLQDICLGFFNKNYTHALSGHTHKFEACNNQYGGMNITNGSATGTNAYGTSNGMVDITPVQGIVYVDQRGKIEVVQPIDLSNIPF